MDKYENADRINEIIDEIAELVQEFCEIAKPYDEQSYSIEVVRTNIYSMLGVNGYYNRMGNMSDIAEAIESSEDDEIDYDEIDDYSFGLEQTKDTSNEEITQASDELFLSPEGKDLIETVYQNTNSIIHTVKAYREETGDSLANSIKIVKSYIADFLSDNENTQEIVNSYSIDESRDDNALVCYPMPLHTKANAKQILTAQVENDVFDTLISNGKGVYQANYAFFYTATRRHGQNVESWANSVIEITQSLNLDIRIIESREVLHDFPKESFWYTRFEVLNIK